MFTPVAGDFEALSYFENKLRKQWNYDDIVQVSNCEIIRYILHTAYETEMITGAIKEWGVKNGINIKPKSKGVKDEYGSKSDEAEEVRGGTGEAIFQDSGSQGWYGDSEVPPEV
jgi:hypothetical protein